MAMPPTVKRDAQRSEVGARLKVASRSASLSLVLVGSLIIAIRHQPGAALLQQFAAALQACGKLGVGALQLSAVVNVLLLWHSTNPMAGGTSLIIVPDGRSNLV